MYIIKKILKFFTIFKILPPFIIIWMIWYMFLNIIIQKWNLYSLSKTGVKIGLKYKQEYTNEFGILSGEIDGYEINIETGKSMSSIITIRNDLNYKDFYFSTFNSHPVLEKNQIKFKSNNWKFNNLFKTKYTHNSINTSFKNNEKFIKLTVKFYTKRIFYLNQLSINNYEIYCEFNFGGPFNSYIPPSSLKDIIDDLILIRKNTIH